MSFCKKTSYYNVYLKPAPIGCRLNFFILLTTKFFGKVHFLRTIKSDGYKTTQLFKGICEIMRGRISNKAANSNNTDPNTAMSDKARILGIVVMV
jgi:hypothetical protein